MEMRIQRRLGLTALVVGTLVGSQLGLARGGPTGRVPEGGTDVPARQAPGPQSFGKGGEVGVVCQVKVLSDKVEDVSSMGAWKRSFIKEGMTDRQKALAVWETVVKFQHQDHCPPFEYLSQEPADDPIKLFNVYGYAICSGASADVVALARYAGLKARGWGINNHSVSEIFWDGEWHMLDAALINYFPKPDGKIASVEEILAAVEDWYVKHPDFKKGDRAKLEAFMATDGGKGWKRGPELLARSPFFDSRGWYQSGESGWYAPMLEFDGTQGGTGKPYVWEWPYTQGYQVNIQLRQGERLTRNWSNKGLHVNQGSPVPKFYRTGTGATEAVPWCLDKKVGEGFLKYSPKHGDIAPGRVGNGTHEYDVPLASGAFRRGALVVENLACRGEDQSGPALHIKDPARPGTLVIRMPSSYVYLSGTLDLKAVVPAGGEVTVSFSDDNGLDWKEVAKVTASGERTIDLKPLVFPRYDYRVKFTLKGQGTGLERLRIVHDIQHSQRALPALARGPNTITFSAGPPEGTITVQGSVNPNTEKRQLTYKDFHRQVNGVADEPLEGWPNFHVTGKQGDITFPVATPGDMVRLRFGCTYRAKAEGDGWDLQVSFDGGKSFRTVDRCAGPGNGVLKGGHSKYVTVSDVPPGARKALVRWSGTRSNPGTSQMDVWNSTTAVYGFRIDADYTEPHGGFRPVKVTYRWEEQGRPKTHVHAALNPEESYRIDCDATPAMQSITLELADSP